MDDICNTHKSYIEKIVTAANVADFTLTAQLFHGVPDLLSGRVLVDMVHLTEIDMVRFQPGLIDPADMVGRQVFVVRPCVHRLVYFRCQHYPVTLTTTRQQVTDDFFGITTSVHPDNEQRSAVLKYLITSADEHKGQFYSDKFHSLRP